jgi:hypothetical protein
VAFCFSALAFSSAHVKVQKALSAHHTHHHPPAHRDAGAGFFISKPAPEMSFANAIPDTHPNACRTTRSESDTYDEVPAKIAKT